MGKKRAHLVQRRQQLVAQAAAQRTLLAQDFAPWRAPLTLADRGIAALGYVRRHPALLVGATLLMVVWRPKRAGVWLSRGWLAWRLGRGWFR